MFEVIGSLENWLAPANWIQLHTKREQNDLNANTFARYMASLARLEITTIYRPFWGRLVVMTLDEVTFLIVGSKNCLIKNWVAPGPFGIRFESRHLENGFISTSEGDLAKQLKKAWP